jgi:hypothetical protein
VAGNGKTRIFAGAGFSVSSSEVQVRGGQVFGIEDSGASWQEYRLPAGTEDAYAVACV